MTRNTLNKKILHKLGFHLENVKVKRSFEVIDDYDFQDEASKYIELVKEYTEVSIPRLITLYQQIRYLEINQIPGDLVECGVWKGGAAGMMALAHLELGQARRTLHLFDSFKGLPKASSRDDEKARRWLGYQEDETLVESHERAVGKEVSQHLLLDKIGYPQENLIFHEGWFQETVPSACRTKAISRIALLRLDGDLYGSTKVCLENFWDIVEPRGIVVIDDYNFFQGCKKAVDEFLAKQAYQPLLHHIAIGGGRYLIKL